MWQTQGYPETTVEDLLEKAHKEFDARKNIHIIYLRDVFEKAAGDNNYIVLWGRGSSADGAKESALKKLFDNNFPKFQRNGSEYVPITVSQETNEITHLQASPSVS